MKVFAKGEEVKKDGVQADFEKKFAKVQHVWKPTKDSEKRYLLTFQYDFSELSEEQILDLAAKWVNKDYQNRMRNATMDDASLEQQESEVISVKEMYTRKERGPVDKKAQTAKYLSQMTQEERDEILRQYMQK